jgi:3-oxoacyl-[acyl-carrier protein] reductase
MLVIGASGAVGGALLERARAAEWNAVGVYRTNDARADAIRREWEGSRGTLRLHRADVSDDAAVQTLLHEWGDDFCPDAIVHLAAPPIEARAVQRTSWEDHRRQLDGALKPVVLVTQPLLRRMLKRGSGRIVGVLSAVVQGVPPRGFASYTTAKYALAGYLRCLAAECAGRGVAVNAVSPGPMETAYLKNLPMLLTDQMRAAIPGSAWIDPHAVAGAIFWLASDAGPAITGCNLPVSAGLSY